MADVSEKHIEAAGVICSAISEFGKPAQETIAAALANAEREGMKRGYLAGFNTSGQGWNAEYPFQDQRRSPEGSPEWVNDRDRFLSEAGGA